MNDSADGNQIWIDSSEELAAFVERISSVRRLGVDTEANGFHAYRPRLCLIQVAAELSGGCEVALVDALAFEDGLGGLGGLAEILEDPSIEKIIHGADNDVRLFYRDAGISLRGLFDTQIAARLLGEKRTGLASLAEGLLDIKVSKSGQRLDWGKRPLAPSACRYAAEDAQILFGLHAPLAARLEETGRGAWAKEECELLETMRFPPEKELSDEELVARISGSHKLRSRDLTALRELVLWREMEAQRRDVPPVHVVPPRQLLAFAQQTAGDEAALSKAGLSPRIIQRYGRALKAAWKKGRAAKPWTRKRDERSARPAVEAPPGMLERLKSTRAQWAKQLGIEDGTLCATTVLKQVARDQPTDLEALAGAGLRRWQVGVLGRDLLEALASPS